MYAECEPLCATATFLGYAADLATLLCVPIVIATGGCRICVTVRDRVTNVSLPAPQFDVRAAVLWVFLAVA